MGAHKLVAAEMMQRIQGPVGAGIVSIAAMISIFAALNGSILTGARVPYAAAREGLFFKADGARSPGISHAWSFDSDDEAAGRPFSCCRENTTICLIS